MVLLPPYLILQRDQENISKLGGPGSGVIWPTRLLQAAVIPAKAGIQSDDNISKGSAEWIPAFAGMTAIISK